MDKKGDLLFSLKNILSTLDTLQVLNFEHKGKKYKISFTIFNILNVENWYFDKYNQEISYMDIIEQILSKKFNFNLLFGVLYNLITDEDGKQMDKTVFGTINIIEFANKYLNDFIKTE